MYSALYAVILKTKTDRCESVKLALIKLNFNVVDPAEKILYQKWGTVQVNNKSKPDVSMKITQRNKR